MVTFDVRYNDTTDTLTLEARGLGQGVKEVTTPDGLVLTVDADASHLHSVRIPYFRRRTDFLELYYLLGPEGVHQLAQVQDDLTVAHPAVSTPLEPLRPRSKGRRLLRA